MYVQGKRSIAELLADDALIAKALGKAFRNAILEHARAGFPIAVSQEGKVVWIPPEEILRKFSQEPSPQTS